MSIADTIIERYKSGTSKEGSVADRILARFGIEDKATKKKKVVEENLALAEKYKAEAHSGIRNTVNDLFGYGADKTGFAESPVSNFLSENLKESTKDRFLQDDVDNGKIEQIKRNSALVSELLKKKRENPSKSSLYDSVLKDLQSQNAELSGSVGGELKNKTDEQLWGQAIGTSAEAAQALPFASLFTQGAKVAGKAGVLQGAKLLSKEGVINVLKNPTFQENALYGGAISGSKALKEQEGPFGVAKDTATGYLTGGTGALALNKGFSLIGRALTKLSTKFFEKIGTRPKADIDPVEVKSTVDEIVGIVDRDLKPEEEQAVMEAFSQGATKEEIVTEVGKAKIEAGFDPSIRLSQVVDELEAGGKKLSLDEIATVKKGMDEGKSFEEIKNTLEPQKAPSTAPKEETGATVPKDTSDNGDEAFLKAVEERFKASKTNKFREATKDEKGRFTGSKSESRMKTGDPERDALSESIQTRIDNLGKDELNKTTQENFDDTSQRIKLEDIQSQIPKAKVEELPRLKEESDRIIKEILDKRAGEFKAASKKEDLIKKARTIANNSSSSLEFRMNLRKEGLDKAFKSQKSAEEFYRRMNGAKYRLANDTSEKNLIVQHNLTEQNLIHSEKLGGVPVPSIAITKKNTPISGFGEITLLGDKNLVDPSIRGTKVFNTDAYSPRYPTIHYTAKNKYSVTEKLRPLMEKTKDYFTNEKLSDYAYDDLLGDIEGGGRSAFENRPIIKRIFSMSKGIKRDASYNEIEDFIEKNSKKFQSFIDDIEKNLEIEEKIFKGFTYSGRRLYKPHTIDNVVNEMKGKVKDAEGFDYGVSSLRASLSKEYRSLESIKKDRKNIVSKEEMESVKEETEKEYFEILDEMGKDKGLFETASVAKDYLRGKIQFRDLSEYGIETKAIPRLISFAEKLKKLPTEYFEAKPQRAVGIGEFKYAVVPDTVSKETVEILKKHGVTVKKYKSGDEEMKKMMIGNIVDIDEKMSFRRETMFGQRFEELTGTKITPEQEAQIKSLHKRMFGDENVEITAQILTPEGQKAFGVYQNKVIKILDGQVDPTDTFYHEAVHKYLDLFTTLDEQKNIYLEARKLWKTDNLDELEEKIAENFIRYAKENEGVVGTMKVLFDKVIDRIKNALNGESSIEALYKDILEGKAKKAPLTSKELQKRTTDLQRSAREKEREMAVIRKGYMSEEKFLAESPELIFDEDVKGQYESFVGLLRRFRTGRQREAILSGDVGSIKKALDGKVGAREIDDIFYSQEKSDDEMLDYFRGIFEKGKKKVTEQEILSSVESKLKTDPDYIRLQDELGDIRKQQENLARDEEASIKSVNESLDEVKKEVEPIQKTKEATLDNSVKQIVPKEKKVSLIASRLNKDLPPDFRIDETYDPKAINKEADRAAELIAENKTKAIQKALDTGTNPMERDAILIELSEIAKRDKDYGTLNDLFNKRSELIRSGAQSLNMEKASILLNPQEQYMRNVVNAKLGKVKISGKDLTPETLAAKRTGIRKETKDVVRRSFKIEDAQELFDKLLCK